jgi:hypothetical protein
MEVLSVPTKSFLKQKTLLKSTDDLIERLSKQLGQEFITQNGITMKEVVQRAFIEGYEYAEKYFEK